MNILKKIFKFIVYLLALFGLIIILFVVYLYFKNPFGIIDQIIDRQTDGSTTSTTEVQTNDNIDNNTQSNGEYDHPLLNDSQEKMLRDAGIDPSALPQEITPEMEACFVTKVGEQRAQEIIGGSEPSTFEIFKLSSCLK